MTDVAPAAMRHASPALKQLLTRQAVQFVAGKNGEDAEDDPTGVSLKRAHGTAQNDDASDDDENAKRTHRRHDDGVAAAADDDDENTAAWFESFVKKKNAGCEADVDVDANRSARTTSKKPQTTLSSAASTSTSRPPEGSEFTTNWFTHNQPVLSSVFENLGWAGTVGSKPRHVLEVGSWEGRSSQWLLITLCRHRGSTLTCIDTWEGGVQYHDIGLDLDGKKHTAHAVEKRFDANIALVTGCDPSVTSPANPVRKVKGRSTPVLGKLMARTRASEFGGDGKNG